MKLIWKNKAIDVPNVALHIDEKRWLYNIGDLIDKTEFFMWFPIINTVTLIGFVIILFFYKIFVLLKLDVLWEKFRNIKL